MPAIFHIPFQLQQSACIVFHAEREITAKTKTLKRQETIMRIFLLAFILALYTSSGHTSLLMKPTYDPDLDYTVPMLNGDYLDNVTHPDEILGFPVGQRVADPKQIATAIELWKTQSNRLHVIEYARSHEGRPLHAVYISSPDNLSKLAQIEQQIDRLSDPRKTNDAEAKEIISQLPAVAWMAYSIHGNETSGADAALASIYHLAASEDPQITKMLDEMIVVIDPLMNPDGRARFAKSLEQYRGTAPNVDDQSLLHRGDWPYGRTNHYFFDLNRDFFYLTQPETKGRVALINKWRPQLMIDGHEMGSQSTYLMGPPRQPLNANIAPSLQKWAVTFSQDQGAAFDQQGWRYFTGEWFENWYPGYSNYAEYRGSMHILYEQSRMAEDGVRRPEGTVQTYLESVHHQFVSTVANLQTLSKHSKAMYQDYWQARKNNVAAKGPYANRSYVILANNNVGRTQALLEKLLAQDIEVFATEKDIKVKTAENQLGQSLKDAVIPKGSYVIPNRQPEAPLIAAIMEFDAEVKQEVLIKERQNTLRDGSSIMYDTTAWNLTMMYGVEALTVPQRLSRDLVPYQVSPASKVDFKPSAIAWAVNGDDDRSVSFAARMMEKGANVRVIDEATELSGHVLSRGTVFVTRMDNLKNTNLNTWLSETAAELSLNLMNIESGYGEGELPDWGGKHFRLLTKPQIGIISHGRFSSYDVGATWWSIDSNLGIRHSQIDVATLSRTDLRRYNTLVLPHGFGKLEDAQKKMLKSWVEQGGTLIAHARSAGELAAKKGLGNVKLVDDVLDKAEEFDIALQREWLATQENVQMDSVMNHRVDQALSYPWDEAPEKLKKEKLQTRNKWQKKFMPSGAMVAGRVDQKHWLSFGTNEVLPLLYSDQPVLMSNEKNEAVIRIGVIEQVASDNESKKAKNKKDDKKKAFGWSSIPDGHELRVRMSGLLWPEAAHRIANSAYLTREKVSKGQIILFSGQPNFRGSARGTNRLLLNALIYGAGLGTSAKVTL